MAVNLPLTLRRKPEKDRREDRGVLQQLNALAIYKIISLR